jgi:DNA polymerase
MCVPPFKDSPELMAEMIAYCEMDVKAMRAISKAMRDLSAEELEDYHVNEKINDRGVLVDVPLCHAAVKYASDELVEIEQIVQEVTGGAITSVRSPRMREWVWDRVDEEARKLMQKDDKVSIDKTVRANLLNCDGVPPDVQEVIQCADDLWASSVAKFNRLATLADVEDERVRGAFVFAGGSATGRASSYGAQVHNFTRKCAEQPDDVRHAMVRGHAIVPRYGKRVTDVLKGMLRPAIIPAAGKHLVVADWAAIEARVNPWLSGRGADKLELFRTGEDVYKVNAAATFNIRVDDVTKDQRQIGKVQELACFGPKTQVLTHNGVKDIVEVTTSDLLWDGESWVQHQGLIYKGIRPVINVCGTKVTPDHLIKTQATWMQAKELVSNKSFLCQALATGTANLPSSALNASNRAFVGKTWLGFNAHAALNRISSWITTYAIKNQPDAMFALKKRLAFGAKIFSSMPMPAQMTLTAGAYSIGCLPAKIDATTPKIEAIQTTVGGAYAYTSLGTKIKPHFCATLLPWMGGINRVWSWIALTSTKVTNQITCALSPSKKTPITNDQFKKCNDTSLNLSPVFDILNCGLNNRFTIVCDRGYLIVHNCGFAGGVGAFAAMGRAYGISLPEPVAKRMVDGWRRANGWAVPYWSALEESYTRAMRNKGREFKAGRITYLYDGQHLWYALPSGRILCYPYAKLESEGVSYAKAAWKPAQDAKEWPRARLWKGLACENVTQAVANDLLRHALRQLDDVVLHVHDEIVIETDREGAAEELKRVMCTAPAWADGLPLNAEVETMKRYGK